MNPRTAFLGLAIGTGIAGWLILQYADTILRLLPVAIVLLGGALFLVLIYSRWAAGDFA